MLLDTHGNGKSIVAWDYRGVIKVYFMNHGEEFKFYSEYNSKLL